jgi:AraC-like DNA-binding protein
MNSVIQHDEGILLAHYGEILYELAVEKGADPDKILQGTNIRKAVLRNPEAALSLEQFVSLIRNAIALTEEPALGLYFGTRLKFTTHGSMAQAAVSSPNLTEAIETLIKYYRTRFAFIEMKFFIEGNEAVLQLNENLGLGVWEPFLIESLFVSIIDVNQLLFGSTLTRNGRCLISYPPPSYESVYHKFFFDNVTFNCGVNQLRFDAQFLNLPMALANQVAQRLAAQECEQQLQKVGQSESIVTRVKRMLEENTEQIPTMEQISEALHITSRTLRRQLGSFDTSFQDILNEVRKIRALKLLKNTNKSVDDIAHELGYSDPSNFGRAFRKWMGKSPKAFRDEG